ncbi:TetR/AcrR family transcriptional regulator [Ornithinimicrobium pratense]|uniref:TetR/AcrR family transcriptional regulator n=1 Tax=Ornithinimicrobium pratense TaxID=2593973 RepID=A0A5J6V5Y5_9MICO|nr:TetR/AcrR family transcriptional regulator [Ornithinimicrobium pratense]QFG69178.1 TetR/AcrR family transcriptional regulator [Ornithinimicrobium pratense]
MSTSPENRPRLRRDQRRVQLLDAALEAFSQGGYHQTLMDDIADRAGVSKPVLYQHFDSKLDLYLGIARGVADEVLTTLTAALASSDNNPERIRACVATFFDFVDRPGSGFPLLFASDMGQEPAVAALLEETRRACGEALAAEVAEATDVPREEAVLVGMALAGVAQTAAMHWYRSPGDLSKERATDVVVALAWRGLDGLPVEGATGAHQDAR